MVGSGREVTSKKTRAQWLSLSLRELFLVSVMSCWIWDGFVSNTDVCLCMSLFIDTPSCHSSRFSDFVLLYVRVVYAARWRTFVISLFASLCIFPVSRLREMSLAGCGFAYVCRFQNCLGAGRRASI